MSVELTRRYFRGEWEFQGKTEYNFDQVNLSIEQSDVVLVLRSKGKEVVRKTFPTEAHFFGEYLLFTLSGHPNFFIVDATENDMICGQQKGSIVGEPLWHVKVKRKHLYE